MNKLSERFAEHVEGIRRYASEGSSIFLHTRSNPSAPTCDLDTFGAFIFQEADAVLDALRLAETIDTHASDNDIWMISTVDDKYGVTSAELFTGADSCEAATKRFTELQESTAASSRFKHRLCRMLQCIEATRVLSNEKGNGDVKVV